MARLQAQKKLLHDDYELQEGRIVHSENEKAEMQLREVMRTKRATYTKSRRRRRKLPDDLEHENMPSAKRRRTGSRVQTLAGEMAAFRVYERSMGNVAYREKKVQEIARPAIIQRMEILCVRSR